MVIKILKVIAVAVVLAIVSGCNEKTDDTITRETERFLLPRGAKIIELVDSGRNQVWAVFELRGDCFLMYDGMRRNSMVPVSCDKYGIEYNPKGKK